MPEWQKVLEEILSVLPDAEALIAEIIAAIKGTPGTPEYTAALKAIASKKA
jgi:hypothetical protein